MSVAEKCASDSVFGIESHNVGMLMPATRNAAGSQNKWNIPDLAKQVKNIGVVTSVGTWSVEFDMSQDWLFADTMSSLI